MLSVEMIRTMTAYNYACHRALWNSIMTLTDEVFATEIPYSHGSIRNHMVHLANVDRGWLRGLKEDPNARTGRANPADYTTRASVRELCEAAAADVTAFVGGLDEATLQYQARGLPMTTWQVLLHLVNHGTDHRAQVLRALHDFGATTFDQDLLFFIGG